MLQTTFLPLPIHLVLAGKSSNTRKLLTLKKFKRGTATSRNMRDLTFSTPFESSSSSVTSTNNSSSTFLGSINNSIKDSLGTAREGIEFKYTRRAVPDNCL